MEANKGGVSVHSKTHEAEGDCSYPSADVIFVQLMFHATFLMIGRL